MDPRTAAHYEQNAASLSARYESAARFDTELRRSLVRRGAEASGWQSAAFAGLVESVETLGLQRGLERWSA